MLDVLAALRSAAPYLEVVASFLFGTYAGKCHASMSFNLDLNGQRKEEECCLVPVIREISAAIRERSGRARERAAKLRERAASTLESSASSSGSSALTRCATA